MGNSQTTSKSDKVGFQITHVAPQSPGAQAGLVVDEDFILTMNGLPVPLMDAEKIMNVCKVRHAMCFVAARASLCCFFSSVSCHIITYFHDLSVQTMINKPVLLAVYSTKTLAMRDVVLIPSENWPGEGILGIKIKLGPYE